MANLVAQPVPAAVLTQVRDLLKQARALLAPYLVPLTPEQRETLPKMGDKTLAFVLKAAEHAQTMVQLMPSYLDVPGLVADAGVSRDLLAVEQDLRGLLQDVDSTRMVAGSEGYTSALLAYGALQDAARHNQPGAAAAVQELKPRFARPAGPVKAKPGA